MKSVGLYLGRFIFFAMLVTQCGFLTAYPAWYKQDARWIPLFLLYAPALFYWIHCLRKKANLNGMFLTWLLYVIALIAMIAIIFPVVGDDLDTKNLLGPNTLKVMLCLTPLLFLFLVNTASDLDDEHKGYTLLVQRLSLQITIDLFDTVEMLDIVLDERDNRRIIPNGFAIAMVAAACFSFLLSLFQLAENKLENEEHEPEHEQLKYPAIIRNVMQIVFVNLPFLIIRLVVFILYKKDETIFMAKNGIAVFLSGLEIYWINHKLNNRNSNNNNKEIGLP
ncbi:uncharacterized protein [Montipora capricornis]|uniref:uncharacterized protein n=1 Tax=Montipora capricornis TaxID=246305 RepID=UPI0035F1AAD0